MEPGTQSAKELYSTKLERNTKKENVMKSLIIIIPLDEVNAASTVSGEALKEAFITRDLIYKFTLEQLMQHHFEMEEEDLQGM